MFKHPPIIFCMEEGWSASPLVYASMQERKKKGEKGEGEGMIGVYMLFLFGLIFLKLF